MLRRRRTSDAKRAPTGDFPDADRRSSRRRRPTPQGADDRPARPSIRRRRTSAVLLITAFLTSSVWLVALVLLSIGVSAAFGLRYSIYGAIWRRIVKVAKLGPTEPEHEYPPRFAQVLGSVALILALVAFALGAATLGWLFTLAVAGLQTRARRDRLLPRLPPVLPALVGAGPRDPDLDARRELEPALRRADPRRRWRADRGRQLGRSQYAADGIVRGRVGPATDPAARRLTRAVAWRPCCDRVA